MGRIMLKRYWKDLTRDEDGAAYAVGYVMTFPIFLLFMAVVVEAALFTTVKLGTIYAAHAAARSYSVWIPSEPSDGSLVQRKAHQAAAQVMAGFASSDPRHLSAVGGGGSAGQSFASAFQSYAPSVPVSSSYITRKRNFAEAATSVTLENAPTGWKDDLSVTVRYKMPYHVNLVGKILQGTPMGGIFVVEIQSKATIQVEGVKDKNIGSSGNPLGIRYDPGEL